MVKRRRRFAGSAASAQVSEDGAVANMGRPAWWRVAAVTGLSVVLGSGWLLTEAYPSKMARPFAGCVHFAVIGVAGMVGARWKGWNWRRVAGVAAAGVGVFVLPGVVGQITAGAVPGAASAVMFCAVPLMIVLGMSWFGSESGRDLFVPGMVGLAGALLLFSVPLPGSLRGAVGLATVGGCCAVVAGASVWMCTQLRVVGVVAAVAVIGMAGAVVLGGYELEVGWPQISWAMLGVEVLRCAVFDLPVVWVTVWLMREVSPARLASRFLIAPVVTWVEGYAMLRGSVEARSVVALVLMLTGAGMLLVKEDGEGVGGLGPRL